MKIILLVFGILFFGFLISKGQQSDSTLFIKLKEISIESNQMIAPRSVSDLLIDPEAYMDAVIKVDGALVFEFVRNSFNFSVEIFSEQAAIVLHKRKTTQHKRQ